MAKDDIYLSPAFGRDVCFIGIIMYRWVIFMQGCRTQSSEQAPFTSEIVSLILTSES